ncbi:uncharacterized protein LOC142985512 [Anticarsia gemmatalis]|uniref:uncharacterized protein LOC142985512 n=1 Tax=Anticarsia gemmatalis TaxID=129554 RepID=UPI003F757CAC
MVCCSILCCKSRSVKNCQIRFFSFPRDESIAKEWLKYCSPKINTKHARVCSKHFVPTDYFKSLRHILLNESPKKVRQLKADAVPSLHLEEALNSSQKHESLVKKSTDEVFDSSKGLKVLRISKLVNNIPQQQLIKCRVLRVKKSGEKFTVIDDSLTKLGNEKQDSSNITEKRDKSTRVTSNKGVVSKTEIKEPSLNNVIEGKTKTIPLKEYKQFKKRSEKLNILEKNLQKIFSVGQRRRLFTPNMRRVAWSVTDIAAAISLRRNISSKGYRHLRNVVKIPLPAFSTLRRWSPKFEIYKMKNNHIYIFDDKKHNMGRKALNKKK